MSFYNYLDPILGRKRQGAASGDPYISITETIQVNANSTALLSEIPNMLARVTIPSMTEAVNLSDLSQLTTTQFVVDYTMGIITVHPSLGLSKSMITPSYQGTGGKFFPVTRIWTKTLDGVTPSETLDYYINSINDFNYQGVYSSSIQYSLHNLIIYQGVMYIAISINPPIGTLPTNISYWSKLGSIAYKNTYSNATTYSNGDYVNFNNQTLYMCLADNTLNIPLTDTTKWKVVIDISTLVNSVTAAESARVTAEASRVTAETGRTSTETIRVSSENTRISQESTRVSQETARQTNTTTAITNLNTTANALSHKGLYSPSTSYVPNNIVNYNGTAFMCILAGTGQTPTSSSTYWKKMNNFINQGIFSNSITYMYGDCVSDSVNQNVYMSIIDNNINQLLTNTSKWQLLVSVAGAITSANTATTNANTATTNANTATSNANTQATYAKNQGDYSKAQGDYANSSTSTFITTVDNTKLIWKPYVSTFSSIATTYPSPSIGWLTVATDTGIRYRYDGSSWIAIDTLTNISNPTPYDNSIVINHNLNSYPDVLAIKTSTAYGNGGFGSTPFGGGSLFKLINTIEYYDTHSMKILLSSSFSGTPTVIQNSTTEFLVNFSADQNSLTIILK